MFECRIDLLIDGNIDGNYSRTRAIDLEHGAKGGHVRTIDIVRIACDPDSTRSHPVSSAATPTASTPDESENRKGATSSLVVDGTFMRSLREIFVKAPIGTGRIP